MHQNISSWLFHSSEIFEAYVINLSYNFLQFNFSHFVPQNKLHFVQNGNLQFSSLGNVARTCLGRTCPFVPNGRREFVPRDQLSALFSVYSFLLLHKNKKFYTSFNHRNRSGLVFYSEKFSTWVWRLPFAVNVNLNLSTVTQLLLP